MPTEQKIPILKKCLPALPIKSACIEILGFLRRVTHASRSLCILGLSGGVDSAVAAYLLNRALRKDKIRAIIMPYHKSDKKSMEDALLIVEDLGIDYDIIDISPCIDSYYKQFPDAGHYRRGNKMARERMSVLYDMAALHGGLVVGTGNKSELLLGYFTKYGDGGVDLEPLGGLYKTYVYEMAAYLGVPESIIEKHPTADLWPGQRDEDDLGIGYEEADNILYCMEDLGESIDDIKNRGFNEDSIEKIANLVRYSKHKRMMPPIPDMHKLYFH
ncbi:MAG: NAD+ synthase [bacterium]